MERKTIRERRQRKGGRWRSRRMITQDGARMMMAGERIRERKCGRWSRRKASRGGEEKEDGRREEGEWGREG